MTATDSRRQSWWQVFLRPGWVFLTLFVVAFSYFAFTVLAPWQLGKDDQIVARNEQIKAAYQADPVPIGEVTDSTGAIQDDKEWSRVTLTGHFLPDKEVLLRLRPVNSEPAYQSLMPFRTIDGHTILTNRGWLPAGEANAVPEIPDAPRGDITVEGMVRKDEPLHENPPVRDQGYQQVYSVNTKQISDITGTDLATDYVQLSADQPGVLNPIPIPQLDRGNHLSYGYQWIAFGIMAPLGLIYFVVSEIRQRRSNQHPEVDTEEPARTPRAELGSAPQERTAESAKATVRPGNDTSPASGGSQADSKSRPTRKRARYGDANPDHFAKLRKGRNERY